LNDEKYFLAVVVWEKPITTVEEAFSSCEEGEPRTQLQVSYFEAKSASQVNAATFATSFIKDGGHKMAVAVLVEEGESLSPWFRTEKVLRVSGPVRVATAHGTRDLYEMHTNWGGHLARIAKMLCFAEGFVTHEHVLPTFLTK